jgi:protein phosphatase
MKIAGKTDVGFKRSDNQDRYVAGALHNGVSFGFVCDGMGGARGGSVASEYLCKTLEEYIYIQNDNSSMNCEQTVIDAIDIACSDIYKKAVSDERLKGMGTTIAGVIVKDDMCTAFNVGDSRVYIYRSGVLSQITEDHSVVRQLYKRGAITAEEMATHPQKNLITRAVGVRNDVDVDITEVMLRKGDRILCASDGLTNYVSKSDLEYIMSADDLFEVPGDLIRKALMNMAGDNITAVVMEYI